MECFFNFLMCVSVFIYIYILKCFFTFLHGLFFNFFYGIAIYIDYIYNLHLHKIFFNFFI
jgi:hypothetical protein